MLRTLHLQLGKMETTRPYNGYYYRIGDILTIAVCGALCNQTSLKDIHGWARYPRNAEFFCQEFGIRKIPSYAQFCNIFNLADPEKFNELFRHWVSYTFAVDPTDKTIAVDGKTIRTTLQMQDIENPLHIASAVIADTNIIIGQKAAAKKSNEIPAVQELIGLLDMRDAVVVADALNCQTKTAEAINDRGGDYLLTVKANQRTLFHDVQQVLKNDPTAQEITVFEKNRDREETRTAMVSNEISALRNAKKWPNLASIGAIKTEFKVKGKSTTAWHFYISSKLLTPETLLNHARLEWRIESMHWLLDNHFDEDRTMLRNANAQESMNILRKIVLNMARKYRDDVLPKSSISGILKRNSYDVYLLREFLAFFAHFFRSPEFFSFLFS